MQEKAIEHIRTFGLVGSDGEIVENTAVVKLPAGVTVEEVKYACALLLQQELQKPDPDPIQIKMLVAFRDGRVV